jgi:tetratricopeptide (TPR) repeat protein
MLKEEFEKLKQSGGGLLSFNNFLSTTKDRTLAYGYAFAAIGGSDVIGVLFQMAIDPKIKSSPFASLDNISYFQGNQSEHEILFSMCTIFRIGEIKQLVTGIWQVDLQLTNEDDDPQLSQLIQYIRNQVGQLPGLLRLGHLMYYMGEWDQAEAFFATLAGIYSHQKDIVAKMHSNVGQILAVKGDLNGALLHEQCALRITQTLPISKQRKLHVIYNNIGDICMRQAEAQSFKINRKAQEILYILMQALQHFQTALSLALEDSKVNLQSISVYHNNIGGALKLLLRYDEALDSFNRCLQIELNILPPTHFSLATTYNNIASVSFHLGDYDKALLNYHQCLAIQRRSLPSKHPLISDTCCNIAMAYDAKFEYIEATKYAKEAVDIGSHCFSSSDTKLQLYRTMYLRISEKL